MNTAFKQDETFRGDFSYSNSPPAIRRFPLPFAEDSYMYSVNIEPHLPGPPGSVTVSVVTENTLPLYETFEE